MLMRLSLIEVLPEEEGIKHIKAAYDAGIQTFDTANVYSNGLSEIILGKAIKQHNLPRDEIVVLTKVCLIVRRAGKKLRKRMLIPVRQRFSCTESLPVISALILPGQGKILMSMGMLTSVDLVARCGSLCRDPQSIHRRPGLILFT
jgi:hypothetical protein